jgi:hypothetical protein
MRTNNGNLLSKLPKPFDVFYTIDWTSDEGEDGADFATMANTAADILHMLSSLEGCEEVLTQLLQQKNLEGYTPFMAAIAYKVREYVVQVYKHAIV